MAPRKLQSPDSHVGEKTRLILADVDTTITVAAGKTLLEMNLDGPRRPVSLRLGKSKVNANFDREALFENIRIHQGDHLKTMFYFRHLGEDPAKGYEEEIQTGVPKFQGAAACNCWNENIAILSPRYAEARFP